ncbi:conserved unknown protein [Ectocarpus siliculosus]|uniref:GPI ethanolamine phosphate transferase 2 C-terminal domain-containing protein n=1 Tax=Ectocarpus siliculosus TaxID=2880 RepID=D8LQQ0_ECTSI|nr:conserved unknown protein [Ectocarpus siliculosus]|eukprot:CBN74927.1 conserved unknown protein [Ectocarpus siliculosus]
MNTVQRSVHNPIHALVFFGWVLAVQLTGLAAFTKGFFLTRVELERQSQCDRVVWVVVDALRYDFAAFSPPDDAGQGLQDKPHSAGARHYLNHLPVINEAIGGGAGGGGSNSNNNNNNDSSSSAFEGSGGVLFQFEADPPTVTMQRLKGLTTGGLPTFIDFRDNFHSAQIAEDNWVAQVRERAARRRGASGDVNAASSGGGGSRDGGGGELVFMGDDTWTSLYPTYFSRSYPFPSFNTRDLHTVDDGVLSHLSTELGKRDWDVLVAHFLGVDHVGHTFGPASQAMEDKLDQMNAALRTVFEGVDDETVVFVLGDHGMTEDGNHGGATPEETGAALLVWSRSGERLLGPGFKNRRNSGGTPSSRREKNSGGTGGASSETVTGADGGSTDRRQGGPSQGHGDVAAGEEEGSEEDHSGPVPAARRVAQIDLVPTISLLLGTPIPFGSLGGVIPEVFGGAYLDGGGSGDDERGPRYLERLCDALLVNSVQVWRYLSDYASVASMPTRDMFDLNELLLAAREAHTEWKRRQQQRSHASKGALEDDGNASASSARELRRVCGMYREFLDASIGLGRSLWTQYDTSLMWWGLAVLLVAAAALAFRAVSSSMSSSPASSGDSRAAAVGAAASLAIAILTDLVFGSSGPHVFAAKVAICSSVGMCIHYAQVVASAGSWTASGAAPPSSGGARTMTGTTKGGGLSVGVAFTAVLSALYCAGLFSNSFIEAEDGLHRFLGASSLVSLAVLILLVPAPPPPATPADLDYDDISSSWTARAVVENTGSSSSIGFASPRCDDRLGLLLGLSPKSTAALYAALAAACLRAAAAVQDSAAEGGVSTEAAFGVSRSLLPLPALWYLCRLARGGGGGGGDGRMLWGSGAVDVANTRGAPAAVSLSGGVLGAASGWARRRCSHGAVQALSLAAIGAYWVNEVVAAAAAEAGKEHGTGAAAAAAATGGLSQGGAAGAALFGSLLPPARLLLPRATYLLCLAGLAVALLRPHGRRRRKQQDPVPQKGEEGRTCTPPGGNGSSSSWSYAQSLAGTAATVVSHLLPVVVLLLGPGSPAVVAFVSAACGCVLRSVSVTAAGRTTGGGGGGRGGAVLPLGAVAVSWSVVGRAFFFLTGHHNQFSRLQYSAAFVGFDEFDFKVGGVLLFLNTFGTEILAALALPLAAAAAAASGVSQDAAPPVLPEAVSGSSRPNDRQSLSSPPSPRPHSVAGRWDGNHPDDAGNDAAAEAQAQAQTQAQAQETTSMLSAMERLSGLTLLLSAIRTFLSAANVSVQRGHLMLWAVFAPKFVFDATMQAVCGAAAVLAWAVVVVAHRAYCCEGWGAAGAGCGLASLGRAARPALPPRKKGR